MSWLLVTIFPTVRRIWLPVFTHFLKKRTSWVDVSVVRNVRRRTSLACGVSESTVTRCCRRSLGESYYRAMDNVENNEKTHHRCISATEKNEKRSGHDSRSFLFASLQKTGICPVSRLKTLKIHSKSAKKHKSGRKLNCAISENKMDHENCEAKTTQNP